MSDQDKELAKEHAALAATQAGYAAKNVARAVLHEKDDVADIVRFNLQIGSTPLAIGGAVAITVIGGLAIRGAREVIYDLKMKREQKKIQAKIDHQVAAAEEIEIEEPPVSYRRMGKDARAKNIRHKPDEAA